jgi:hypothetical protein
METVCSSETSISNYQTSFLHNPQNHNMNRHRHENLNSTHKINWLWNYYWILSIVLCATRLSGTGFASVIRCREEKYPVPLDLLGRDTLCYSQMSCVGGTVASANQSFCVVLIPTCSSVSHTWHLAVADSVCCLELLSLPSDREQLCLAAQLGRTVSLSTPDEESRYRLRNVVEFKYILDDVQYPT